MPENVLVSFLNGRVGRTTGRQMFKQCVHSPLVRRGPPCLAAFKADTVGWRLGASCATKLLVAGPSGRRGRFYTSKPRRQREEMERWGWCRLHSIVLTTGTTEDRVWWLRNWTFNILMFCRLGSGCCPPLTHVKCVWMAVSVVQLTQYDSALHRNSWKYFMNENFGCSPCCSNRRVFIEPSKHESPRNLVSCQNL